MPSHTLKVVMWYATTSDTKKYQQWRAPGYITFMVYIPEEQAPSTASSDNKVKKWNVNTGPELKTLDGHTYGITCMVYVPEEQAPFTASSDNTVKKWNVKTGPELKTLDGHTYGITCMVYVPEEQALFTGSSDKTVKMWNVKDA